MRNFRSLLIPFLATATLASCSSDDPVDRSISALNDMADAVEEAGSIADDAEENGQSVATALDEEGTDVASEIRKVVYEMKRITDETQGDEAGAKRLMESDGMKAARERIENVYAEHPDVKEWVHGISRKVAGE